MPTCFDCQADFTRTCRQSCLAVLLVVIALSPALAPAGLHNLPDDLTQFVDPLIGSDGHGHVFVGASVPFGAVQVGPNNVFKGWDWCSGYHYSDDVVIGFSHLHLSGTGCADLGDILLMPHAGELKLRPGSEYAPTEGYASRYSHRHETARAGYYAVDLLTTGVRVELTATERAGFHRYTFPEGKAARLVVDLQTGNGNPGEERTTQTSFEQVDGQTFAGRRFSTGWAKDQRTYFALVTSVPAAKVELLALDGTPATGSSTACRAIISFPANTTQLLAKVGISGVSEKNAQLNVDAEIHDWNFDAIADQARQKWNDGLQAIKAEFLEDAHARAFYTAMYHSMISPALFNDINGDYRGADGAIHRQGSFVNYTVLSLWDSYRAEHPLLTLIQPQRVDDFVNTMVAIADEQGKLPVWHLMGNETDTMIGYSAAPVIADAYLKGFRGFSPSRALAAMTTTAKRDDLGLLHLKQRGFIPADREVESVAKGLEYAIDDWCIAAMAEKMGDVQAREEFTKRSAYYKNYFDRQTGFMRGKLADRSWRTPFDPAASAHRKDDYCEGNAWQYTWLVPQDVEGLIGLLGGREAFVEKLDKLFVTPAQLGEGASADISGLIGQYAHGNEPGHHIPYLAACAGRQWKTADRVREIMTTLYDDSPAGLCGNEDCGQMSAWYVFSALGFYPVNPADGNYILGSPLVRSATITPPGGKAFRIEAVNNSLDNKFIQSVELNGRPLNRVNVSHADILAGGTLTVRMGPTPNKHFPSMPGERAANAARETPLGATTPTLSTQREIQQETPHCTYAAACPQ
jgi:predicted alpha-1,2-mannosidase